MADIDNPRVQMLVKMLLEASGGRTITVVFDGEPGELEDALFERNVVLAMSRPAKIRPTAEDGAAPANQAADTMSPPEAIFKSGFDAAARLRTAHLPDHLYEMVRHDSWLASLCSDCAAAEEWVAPDAEGDVTAKPSGRAGVDMSGTAEEAEIARAVEDAIETGVLRGHEKAAERVRDSVFQPAVFAGELMSLTPSFNLVIDDLARTAKEAGILASISISLDGSKSIAEEPAAD